MSTQTIERSVPDAVATEVPAPRRLLLADAGVIRTAMLDVIDGCDPEAKGMPWALWHPFEGVGTDARTRFCDAVIERIQVLQSPTFNLGIKLENYCSIHRSMRLPLPTTSKCVDCAAERASKE